MTFWTLIKGFAGMKQMRHGLCPQGVDVMSVDELIEPREPQGCESEWVAGGEVTPPVGVRI